MKQPRFLPMKILTRKIRYSCRACNKTTYHNYMCYVYFLKRKHIIYRILPILIPTFKKYDETIWEQEI